MAINIIPTPKKAIELGGRISVGAVRAFGEFTEAAVSFDIYRKNAGISSSGETVEVILDESVAPSAYILDADRKISLRISDLAGANHGFATILQLLLDKNDGTIPKVRIEDAPDCEFRTLFVDNARFFHPMDVIKKYIDLCWFYKMSAFQIHLSDDQSFTVALECFPKLATEDRHYTRAEINEIVEYAQNRGVELIPEIDIPGHARVFAEMYPEIFGDGRILDFSEASFEALRQIFTEIAQIFKYSKRIHIGGDEPYLQKWIDTPKAIEYARKIGITIDDDVRLNKERMLVTFINKMGEIVMDLGRTAVCWESFAKDVNDMFDKRIEVYAWENYYQVTPSLVAAGCTLMNASWTPNYIVTGIVKWTPKECFDWDIFTFKPVHTGSPFYNAKLIIDETEQMKGGMLLSWNDYGARIESPELEQWCKEHYLTSKQYTNDEYTELEFNNIAERIPCTAENTWNKHKAVTWEEFEPKYQKLLLTKLD